MGVPGSLVGYQGSSCPVSEEPVRMAAHRNIAANGYVPDG
jgi:hypothetical protein